jgi:hypothetical protein
MKLPLYILDIDEDLSDESAVFAAGFVTKPATESEYRKFDGATLAESIMKFEVVNEELQILGGYLMVADQPIFRKDEDGTMYYVAFPKTSIEKIVHKLARSKKSLSFNFDHNDNKPSNSAYMFQHFMIDETLGIKAPEGFDSKPNGSWFGYVKVNDKEEWEEAKKRNGFSVEGWFNEVKLLDADELILQEISNKIISNKMDFEKMKKSLGSELVATLKSYFSADKTAEELEAERLAEEAAAKAKLEAVKTALKDGSGFIVGELVLDAPVTMEDAEGNEIPLENGTYEVEGEIMSIEVTEGVVSQLNYDAGDTEMTPEEIMAAIQNAGAEVETSFNAKLKTIQDENSKVVANYESKLAAMFEAISILASEDVVDPKADPKRKSVEAKKNNFAKIQSIIAKQK